MQRLLFTAYLQNHSGVNLVNHQRVLHWIILAAQVLTFVALADLLLNCDPTGATNILGVLVLVLCQPCLWVANRRLRSIGEVLDSTKRHIMKRRGRFEPGELEQDAKAVAEYLFQSLFDRIDLDSFPKCRDVEALR